MQLALDPNIGKKEIGDLNKDLHLKKLTLDSLIKQQEKIILEIDKVINKKDNIVLKYGS
jgi:hypothetical protein